MTPAQAPYRIELFGEIRVTVVGQRTERLGIQKAVWLLARLAMRPGQPFTRDQLIDLFWPDMDLDAGRDNLSSTLTILRRLLGDAGRALRADRSHVRLDAEAVTTDVAECDALLRRAANTQNTADRAALLERAIGWMVGDLLPGCYEEWALIEQRRWQERKAGALLDWAELLEAEGRIEEALTACERAAEADPDREDLYRTRMRLLARQDRVPAALELYGELERRLREDLSVMPSAATRELADRIRRNPDAFRLPPKHMAPLADTILPQPVVAEVAPEEAPTVVLPLQLTRLFGREKEIAQVVSLLMPHPAAGLDRPSTPRLVTLTGPGGAGKTRLSIEVARWVAPHYPGGIWFVSLAELPDPRLIPAAIAGALGITPSARSDPMEETVLNLEHRRCLLILDNFEHLLNSDLSSHKGDYALTTGLRTMRLLLERIPGLTCLITSRQPLDLHGEQEFSVPPLAVPPAILSQTQDIEEMLACSSVALYVDRAREVRPDFALTPQNQGAVASLCRRLEGMPLALEMAATWVRTLPPVQMLEHLEGRLTALTDRRKDVPTRQRSLRAAIEWSYDLLEPSQRILFSRLAIFRGGWTQKAAEAICSDFQLSISDFQLEPTSAQIENGKLQIENDQVLQLLTDLVERSMALYEDGDPEGRYRMLEPLREFAAEKLAQTEERPEMLRRHAAYFLELAKQAGRTGESEGFSLLWRERDNLRAALDGARELQDAELELSLAASLKLLWVMKGLILEGRQRLREALKQPYAQERTIARAYALHAEGLMAQYQHDLPLVRTRFEEALAILRERDDDVGITLALQSLGWLAEREGRFEESRTLLQETLARNRERGNRNGVAQSLGNLGVLAMDMNNNAESRACLQKCITLFRELGDQYHVAAYLGVLGQLETTEDRHEQARACLEEALEIQQALGDRSGIACTLLSLGMLQRALGDEERAEAHWRESLTLSREMNLPTVMLDALEALIQLRHRRAPRQALQLVGATQAYRSAGNREHGLIEPEERNAVFAELQSALSPAEFEAAMQGGAALTLEQAAERALGA